MFSGIIFSESSRPRSRKSPSFLDDLAFATVATREERIKIREKRRRESKSSSKEGKRSRSGSESRSGRKELEKGTISGTCSEVEEAGTGKLCAIHEQQFSSEEEEYSQQHTWESVHEWDTAPESFYPENIDTAHRVFEEELLEATKKLSLEERREKTGGSTRHRTHRKRDSTHSARNSRPVTPQPGDTKLPGDWPSRASTPQRTERSRHSSPTSRGSSESSGRIRLEDIVRTSVPGEVAQSNRKNLYAEEKASRSRRSSVQSHPVCRVDPNYIPSRRPRRGGSGNRHLPPGAPLTEENLRKHTAAGGGQKSYCQKSSGWTCPMPDDEWEDDGRMSEGSLWDGAGNGDLMTWDSVSVRG